MSVEENKEIEKTVKILNELSLNAKEREEYESRLRALMRYTDNMDCSREEGREDGRKEEKRKIVEKLLSKNMPYEQIAEITELAVQEITAIAKNKEQ